MNGRPHLCVIEDDAVHRRMLQQLAGSMNLHCQAFTTGRAFIESDPPEHGCILLDLCLPDMSGLRVQAELDRQGCRTPVIMMSGHADTSTAVEAMKRGALDFLVKPLSSARLLEAINEAVARSERLSRHLADCDRLRARIAALSERERMVMDLVVEGKANKQVAAQLGLSQRTVESHRTRIMRKMGVDSLAQLARAVERVSLVS